MNPALKTGLPSKEELAGRIIVAMDYPEAGQAESLLSALEGIPCYLKVGMQLFYSAGPGFVESLKKRGYQIFLDLKMHDIPNTVKGGAESITRLGVDMFNVHASGGLKMMEAAMEGVDKAMTGLAASGDGVSSVTKKPLVIAVTQLTSTDQQTLNHQIGIPGSLEDSVTHYAMLTKQAKLDGVVASAREVQMIKQAAGTSFLTVTPGIRPAGSDAGDQSRMMTPAEALAVGTDYMVIGRPITAHANPRLALETILEEMLNHGHA
ncbi:orotidine-5'-phosphate decarboxylase [Gorillibacterium timonense]|uniref:orotidine-5'-phosphate decarboxylase n=1 Tax=Gorillibacterium timonense TaxID=1689269 RepID=UPI00071D2037|nr:orotidine-5'-phosphate decarboxylase [Gorillibacterium timonense]